MILNYGHTFGQTIETYYGLYQPGEIYVLISNNLAHFLMYLYYAFPKELKTIKYSITLYQYVQHLLALILILSQNMNNCKINYPIINIIGYVYFFYEYLLLVFKNIVVDISFNTYTSLLFVVNVYYLLSLNDNIYSRSFTLLLITSVINHSVKSRYISYVDKIATYNIIYQGGIRLFNNYHKSKILSIIVILSFISVVYLYFVGYIYSKYCFDKKYGRFYHGLLHFQSCFGHLLIMLLIKL